VIPYERAHGHFGAKVAGTLPGAISEINRDLCERAQRHASVFICDIDYLAAWAGRRNFFDERLWALAKSLCSLELLPEVAQSIVDIAMASLGRGIKCVVLDLDNTLWGGVIGDDGLDGIGLGDLDEGGAFRFFQLFLRSLWERGILLAVCSKNTESTARRVFQEHPSMILREQHIAMFVANWEDKASNIRRIREKLNIGFDSMVFLDDNPFERNLVRQLVPEILVPDLPEDPGLYVRAICELNLFESAGASALDSQRTALYQTAEKRESLSFGYGVRYSFTGHDMHGLVLGPDGRCTGTPAGTATAIEPGIAECDLVRLKGKPATDVLVGESGKGQREVQVLYSEPGGRELYFFVNNRLDRIVKP